MSTPPLQRVVQHLRRLARPPRADAVSDRQLLAAFAGRRDEAAFAELVRRHGALVRGVCRRVLGGDPAADDAFQATFLLLARRAGSSGWGDSVAGWLHATAWHVAQKARRAAERRRRHEANAPPLSPDADPATTAAWRELCQVLDEELARLPERLRAPLALCYLEGHTRDEAAKQLGWTLGTLKDRLERGRAILRDRLTRRGVTLAAAGLPAALVESAVSVATAAATAEAAAGFVGGEVVPAAVAALLQPGLTWLTGTKLGVAGVVLALGGLAIGVGMQGLPAPEPTGPLAAASPMSPSAQAPGKDWFGDPLPSGAVARLGTVAFRTSSIESSHIVFSPDGRTMATTSPLLFWHADTGRPDGAWIRGADGSVSAGLVQFVADGKTIRAVCQRVEQQGLVVTLGTWDVTTRQEVARFVITGSHIGRGRTGEPQIASSAHCRLAPHGRMLAALDYDLKGVRLWDADLGRVVHHLTPNALTIDLAFSGDGKTLVTAHDDHVFRVWDVAAGKEAHKFAGDPRSRVAIALSTDGRTLASVGCSNRTGPLDPTVYVWDVASGRRLHEIDTQTANIVTLAFTPDSRGLLTSSVNDNSRLRRWDLTTGQRVWESPRNTPGLMDIAFRPDGQAIAGDVAGRIVLWDVATGRELGEQRGHTAGLLQARFTPDGRRVITESRDGTRREWDATTGEPLMTQTLAAADSASVMSASDGRRFVTMDVDPRQPVPTFITRLREGDNGRVMREWPPKAIVPPHALFSPDGQWLALIDSSSSVANLLLCESGSGREVWSHQFGDRRAGSIVFTPDSRRLTIEDGRAVRTMDVATGQVLHSWELPAIGVQPGGPRGFRANPPRTVISWAYTPDGRHLALALPAGPPAQRWVVCEAEAGKIVADVSGPNVGGRMAFAPDGRRLATAGGIVGPVRVWDWRAGRELQQFSGHRREVMTLAFSPDGRRLVSGSYDTTALVWDVSDVRLPDR